MRVCALWPSRPAGRLSRHQRILRSSSQARTRLCSQAPFASAPTEEGAHTTHNLALASAPVEELLQELEAAKTTVAELRRGLETAALLAAAQLEARDGEARKASYASAKAEEVKRDAQLRARERELDEKLSQLARASQDEQQQARSKWEAQRKTALASATAESRSAAQASQARCLALETQLSSMSGLAERLTALLHEKAEADSTVAALTKAHAEQEAEGVLLRRALAAAEGRAVLAESRASASQKAVAERVRQTLHSASAIVRSAEATKEELESRHAAAAHVSQQMLAAVTARAEAAEAQLARSVHLLDALGEATAANERMSAELGAARLHIATLEIACASLRVARQEAHEASLWHIARAETAEANVETQTTRRVKAAEQRMTTKVRLLEADGLAVRLKAAEAQAAAATEASQNAQHRLAVREESAKREREASARALATLERSRTAWKTRALQMEADAAAGVCDVRPARRRLMATLTASELRVVVARGPWCPETPVFANAEPLPAAEQQQMPDA